MDLMDLTTGGVGVYGPLHPFSTSAYPSVWDSKPTKAEIEAERASYNCKPTEAEIEAVRLYYERKHNKSCNSNNNNSACKTYFVISIMILLTLGFIGMLAMLWLSI